MKNVLAQSELSPAEIGKRGREIYNEKIRAQVIDDHHGEILALDIDSGAYEIDRDSMKATDKLRARVPNATIYALRIGFKAVYSFGARTTPEAQ